MAQDEQPTPVLNVQFIRFDEPDMTTVPSGIRGTASGALYVSGGELVYQAGNGFATTLASTA